MKSILLIGMGKFGQTLGTRLLNMGDEVMIVDKNEDIINALAPKYTNALIATYERGQSFHDGYPSTSAWWRSTTSILPGDHLSLKDPARNTWSRRPRRSSGSPAPQRRRRSHLSRPRYRRKAGRC
ncbi:MAG: NAD-binding protein [Christensenellaceae bacterium]